VQDATPTTPKSPTRKQPDKNAIVHDRKKSLFGNLFNKLKPGRQTEAQNNAKAGGPLPLSNGLLGGNNQIGKSPIAGLKKSENSWLNIVSEGDIYQKVTLPKDLLTYEEYQTLRVPPMRNFIFR
jgi:hypothetical protein